MSNFIDNLEEVSDEIDFANMLTLNDAKLNENANEFIYWQ